MGRSVPRLEDHRFLTGAATYADDLNVEGQAWGVVVRSPHAHAAIKSIDLSPALEMSDIIGVYTEADLADDDNRIQQPRGSSSHARQRAVDPRSQCDDCRPGDGARGLEPTRTFRRRAGRTVVVPGLLRLL